MFCESKEDIFVLNDFMREHPDCCPLLADALIWVYRNKPEKYDEIIEKCKDFKINNNIDEINNIDE